MAREPTTVRIPEELADTAEVVARAQGVSVSQPPLNARTVELDRVRQDEDLTRQVRTLVERDREMLGRLTA